MITLQALSNSAMTDVTFAGIDRAFGVSLRQAREARAAAKADLLTYRAARPDYIGSTELIQMGLGLTRRTIKTRLGEPGRIDRRAYGKVRHLWLRSRVAVLDLWPLNASAIATGGAV
jgi:hypothetical protein